MLKRLVLFGFLFMTSALTSNFANPPVEQYPFGNIPIIQLATNETQTTLAVLLPRLKKYRYKIIDLDSKQERWIQAAAEVADSQKLVHWKVAKVEVSGLQLDRRYELVVYDEKFDEIIDRREFGSLDTAASSAKFVLGSCMTDDFRVAAIRDKIWKQIEKADADFFIFTGDQVYVDGFEFVPRKTASEFDLWQRYIDTARVLPLYSMQKLKPVFAIWDDHDMGTNNADRDFANKAASLKVFQAFFGTSNISGFLENGAEGVYKHFKVAGQHFFMLDARYFRALPEREQEGVEAFGQYGKTQTEWLLAKLAQVDGPVWLIQGDQFFAPAVVKQNRDGSLKHLNESYLADHPTDFREFLAKLGALKVPVVFASGDIHFSEFIEVGPEWFGQSSVELTSSPVHSYIYWDTPPWDNKYRMPGGVVQAHNFMLVNSSVEANGSLKLDVKAIGHDGSVLLEHCFDLVGRLAR